MDNIILTDVSVFISETRNTILEELGNDSYYVRLVNAKPGAVLYEFYNWSFRYAMRRFYYVTVADSVNNYSFQNAFNKVELNYGRLFREGLSGLDLQIISHSDRVQIAFNGKLLFIMPCHVNI